MTEKPKRKNKNRLPSKQIVIWVAVFLGLIFGSSFLLVLYLGSQFDDTTLSFEGDEAIARIAHYIEAPVPDSAQDIYLWSDVWTDVRVKIRLSLPPDAAELWLMNSELCFGELSPYEVPESSITSYKDPEWWTFDGIENAVHTFCQTNGYDYTVLIDQTHENLWTIFITVFAD